MSRPLPASFVVSPRESVLDDVEPWRGKLPQEKAQAVVQLAALAIELLKANPNAERAAAWQDPVPASTTEHWRRLMKKAR